MSPAGPAAPDEAERLFREGVALQREDKVAEALRRYQEVLARKPRHAAALSNVGGILFKKRQWREAEQYLRAARAADPRSAMARNVLARLLWWDGRLDEAEALAREASELEPRRADLIVTHANVLTFIGRLDEAERRLEEALRLDPARAAGRSNLGGIQLLRGNWREGWPNFATRLTDRGVDAKFRGLPDRAHLWRGEPLHGRPLLAWSELGFGDTLQFVRYTRPLLDQGVAVTAAVQRALAGLLGECLAWKVPLLERESLEPSRWKEHVPLMGLPAILDPELDRYRWDEPYLRVVPDAPRSRWGLPEGRKLVGIVWASSPGHPQVFKHKSVPATRLVQTLLAIPEATLVGLQVGAGAEELEPLLGPRVLRPAMEGGSFLDYAKLVARLDAVVSVDTALAHLAGAMGMPAWTLLAFSPDWRWGLGKPTTPWYPRMRLVRQPRAGDWDAALQALRDEVSAFLRR